MYTDQTLEFEKVETSNGTFRDEIILFLKNNGLGIDGDIEQFVVARCRRQLVACAGLAGNTLKCIAVAREWRGTALTRESRRLLAFSGLRVETVT